MREIKFRIWDGIKLIYQDDINYIDFRSGFASVFDEYNYVDNCSKGIDIDNIMQYTGLKDIEGKEIYEGDIVEFLDEEVNYSHCGVEYDEFINIGKVIFSHDELMGWDITNRNMDLEEVWHYREYIKVIGNIYENPELLEGK